MAILKDAPAGAQVLDLGAARAARTEARVAAGEANPVIKLSVGFVEVNPEFSVTVAELLTSGQIREGLAGLLADPEDADAILVEGFSRGDLQALFAFLGTSLGEA